jgi:hypothetical protein
MKIRHLMAIAAVALSATAITNPASAAPMTVTGTLNWDGGPDTTPYSADGSIATFSFVVDNVLPQTPGSSTTTISNFSYSLDNAAVNVPTPTVTFFDDNLGGFDFNFGDGPVSIYGPNVGNVDNTWIIGPGNFTITAALYDVPATADGSLQISGVPLPGALPMFGTALAGLLGAGFARNRRRAV